MVIFQNQNKSSSWPDENGLKAGIADDSGTGMTKVVCHCNIYDKFVILLHSDNDSNEKLESDSMTDL
jgi:hypothetical protein